MGTKKSGIVIVLLIVAANSLSKQIPIKLSPYASGEVVFKWDSRPNVAYTFWHPDTVVFSSGTIIALMEQNLFIVRNYAAEGAITFIDTVSSVGYKYNTSLRRIWHGNTNFGGSYSRTDNNPDTNWNEALFYPETLAICDSIVAGDQVKQSIFKSRCIYSMMKPMSSTFNTSLESGYNSILYIKAAKKYHIKLQASRIEIVEDGPHMEGMYTYPYTINLLWAADSLGNKKFKHDPVTIKQDAFNKKSIGFVMSESNGTIRYSIPQSSHRIEINLYALNGKKIKTLVNGHKPAGENSLHV